MTSATTRLAAGLAALAATVAVSSCAAATKEDHGGHDTTSAAAAGPESSHNADDAMFAQLMIPHHQQAVELAALVPDRSTNPALITLASAISAQQQPEIDTMKGMLAKWGVSPDASHDSGHAGMAMQGMVDDATMVKLEALRGSEFDQLWLTSMISHHRGAIAMANTEIDDGKNTDMMALARTIVTAQQAEIDQMTAMLSGGAG